MKRILLAISGSIAFYKAYELISAFKNEGFKVKVLLSEGVLKFASKMSFEALCESVLCAENETWLNDKNHIAFSKDCDIIVFAPASVNSINKLASGIADNVFIQTLIAANAPLIIAPAANSRMLSHFSTKRSLKLLEENGAIIVPPVKKQLACGEFGVGALAESSNIVLITKRELFKDEFFKDKALVITGGGTKEKIDEVRFIGNFSSGKTAKAIADAFFILGAKVTLLSSVEYANLAYECEFFQSSKELELLLTKHKNKDFLIMSAAVSDFTSDFHSQKLKKSDYEKGLCLHLKPAKDLLKECEFKGKKIGFKLETNSANALQNAKNALKEKKLDMVCLNVLSKENAAFGSDFNTLTLISKNDLQTFKHKSKNELALEIARWCKSL